MNLGIRLGDTAWQGMEDAAVLRAYAASRDPRAFEVLADRYRSMVLATCRRVLRVESDAEDAAQETFLKLARHAHRIRSNAAAWLHACAMRTAIDIARKHEARQRAERAATVAHAGEAADDAATWAEIEPILDAALAALADADRDVIVARFLAGTSQAELARRAGVPDGTMHRRIDRALEKLRRQLARSGLSMAGAGALAVVMGHAAARGGEAIAAPVARVALAGLAAPPAGISIAPWMVAAAVGLVAVAGAPLAITAMRPAAGVPGVAKVAGFERPARATPAHPLTSVLVDGLVERGMRFDGRTVRFELVYDAQRRARGVTATVVSMDRDANPPRLTARVDKVDLPKPNEYEPLLGQTLPMTYTMDAFGRVVLSYTVRDPEGNEVTNDWLGARVPAEPGEPEPKPGSLEGLWIELQPWSLKLDRDDITVVSGEWTAHRFRILEWASEGDVARVQTICADSFDQRLVGDRVKMLLRRDEDGYTLAYIEPDHPRAGEWPGGFEPKPGEGVRVFTWRKGRP